MWSYGMPTSKWTRMPTTGIAARTDAAMAADDKTLVVFGGRDANDAFLADLLVLDLGSGSQKSFRTNVTARANAALAIVDGKLYVYGGQTAAGASDLLDVVDLWSGKSISSNHADVAALSGSGLQVDDSGVVTIVPGAVPGSSLPGGAYIGVPGKFAFVEERSP